MSQEFRRRYSDSGLRRDGENDRTEPEDETESIKVPEMTTVGKGADVADLGIEHNELVEDKLASETANVTLPDSLRDIVQDEGVMGDRPLFTWKWIYQICGELITLPCVADEYVELAQESKFLAGVYITLVDDLAEKHGDEQTFWELSKVMYPAQSPDWDRQDINRDYVKSAKRVWQELQDRLEDAPRWDRFQQSFRFDFRTAIQSMDFARVSEESPGYSNRAETWYYETPAIGQLPVVDIDLMFSPEFDTDDLEELREIVHELQHMWRLGNWIITWEREVKEGDFSAGIFVEAVRQGVVSESELDAAKCGEFPADMIIERISESGIVEQFIADWKRRRDGLREVGFQMESVDGEAMIDDIESLMQSHLAREEYE